MKEIDYIQSLPFDKGCDYVYAWLKENKQGDYLDTLLRFKDFLIKEHRETLPLCPFTGCEGCDRKPHNGKELLEQVDTLMAQINKGVLK